jgi:uncharacterized protein DUF4124
MFCKFPLSPLVPCLAAGALALLLAGPVGAEVYKWVDENGVVNYGSAPPPGRPSKELPKDASGISVIPAPPPPPPTAARSAAEIRAERAEQALAAERAARYAQDQAAEDSLRAAIAQCEENHGVDCKQNPYQDGGGGYGYAGGYFPPGGRPFGRHHFGMTPVPKPLPAFKHRPAPMPARTGPAASHPRLPMQ